MFPSMWYDYIHAVQTSLLQTPENIGSTTGSARGKPIPPLDYGLLGTPGFSVGAFLQSPYSNTGGEYAGVPDIQLTVFPNVSIYVNMCICE